MKKILALVIVLGIIGAALVGMSKKPSDLETALASCQLVRIKTDQKNQTVTVGVLYPLSEMKGKSYTLSIEDGSSAPLQHDEVVENSQPSTTEVESQEYALWAADVRDSKDPNSYISIEVRKIDSQEGLTKRIAFTSIPLISQANYEKYVKPYEEKDN